MPEDLGYATGAERKHERMEQCEVNTGDLEN